MQNKTLSFSYVAKPISYEKINDKFTRMKCYVLALGKNRNFSHISKEAVDSALPSLALVPVVAHLQRKDNGEFYIGSHDRQIVIEDNQIYLNDLTVPFGVVEQNFESEYVDVTESDGTIATYLTCSLIVWSGRYEGIMDAIYSDEIYFGQSMEIIPEVVEPLKSDTRYQDIKEFSFSALCLLGKSDDELYHSEPCFPSARVEPYQYELDQNKFKEEFSLMLSELKQLAFSFEGNNLKEGGKEELDEKLELIAKYNLTVESLDFNIEDFSLEELEEKLKEFSENEPDVKPETVEFSATYRQKREALGNALDPKIEKDADGNLIYEEYYWVSDFDDEMVYVERSIWTPDNYENKYGRYSYSFDSENLTATITGEFEEMVLTWLTIEENQKIQDERTTMSENYEKLTKEFEDYKLNYSTPNTEVEELKNYQIKIQEEERENAETEIFTKFDKQLTGVEEYETLKANSKEYDLETLSDRCFSILGRKTANFTVVKPKENTVVKLPVEPTEVKTDAYGGLFSEFLDK